MTCPAIPPRSSIQCQANTGVWRTPAFLFDPGARRPAPAAAGTQRSPPRLRGPQGTRAVNARRRGAWATPARAPLLPPALSPASQAGPQSGWKPGSNPPRGVRSPGGPRRGPALGSAGCPGARCEDAPLTSWLALIPKLHKRKDAMQMRASVAEG